MENQSEYAVRQRGGIQLRDYTQDGSSLSLSSRIKEEGVRGGLDQVNFSNVARALTMFSVGLGLMQILMPGRVQRMIGIRRGDHTGLIRLMGLREMGHALYMMMQSRPARGAWSRVAGDALDLGLLSAAFGTPRVQKNRVKMAAAAVLGVTALDALTATQLSRKRAETKQVSMLTNEDLNSRMEEGAFHVSRSITINRSPEELYQFWRNFANLPRFMYHLEGVHVIDERRSHWVARAPGGARVSWDAEITEDRPNEIIAWQSLPGADVTNNGWVRFVPGPAGRGTIVHVEIEYRPPGGAIGRTVAQLFGEEPAQQIKGDLHRFKQVIETGEVVRSEGSLQGFGQKLQRPARPVSEIEKRKQGKNLLGKLLTGKLFSNEESFEKDPEEMARRSSEHNRTR